MAENNKNNQDELTCTHKIEKKLETLRIFGDKFVENNKNNCRIFYNGEEHDLSGTINVKGKGLKDLEIKLKGLTKITNSSYMFYGCSSLIYLSDMSKWDTKNISDMSYMFCDCKSLLCFPNISRWNTSNVTNMSYMFSYIKSLSFLPNISKWDTSKVTNMSFMFLHCSSLSSLPDISNWDTSNVTNMSSIFQIVH